MSVEATVRDYYEALRRGDLLSPYFAEREEVVKFGVGERLAGYEAVADGLREQTRTTADWQVESSDLRVVSRETVAWFTDDVAMSWTGSERAEETDASGSETRHSFETRWSGVLERDAGEGNAGDDSDRETGDDGESGNDDGESRTSDDSERDEPDWRFVQMHVSAPHEL